MTERDRAVGGKNGRVTIYHARSPSPARWRLVPEPRSADEALLALDCHQPPEREALKYHGAPLPATLYTCVRHIIDPSTAPLRNDRTKDYSSANDALNLIELRGLGPTLIRLAIGPDREFVLPTETQQDL